MNETQNPQPSSSSEREPRPLDERGDLPPVTDKPSTPIESPAPPLREQPPPLGLPPTELPPYSAQPPRRSNAGCVMIGVLALLACGLLSGVAAIAGVMMNFGRIERGIDLPVDGSLREVQAAQFDVGASPRLEIRNDNGRTEVRVGDVRAIQVEATKRASGPNAQQRLNEIQLDMTQAGDTVRLGYRRARAFNFFSFGGAAVDFVVTVPTGTTVEVDTDNGATVIEGVRNTVNVKSDNGSVTLRNIEGPVTAETDNGRIIMTNVRGRLAVTTDNGSIELTDVQADSLRARSDNGSITFNGTLGEGSHEIRSSNGRVSVTLPRDQRLRVDVQTDNGSINNRLQLTDTRTERNRLSGVLNGGGSNLTIRTNNGSVTLDQR